MINTKNSLNNKIIVGLVQINNSFSGQNYFPYSLGLLVAYAQKYPGNKDLFDFLVPIYKREAVSDAVNNLEPAEIIFFSTYVWNTNISLEIAKKVKKDKPGTLIVFGGPQISIRNTEPFLRENPFVDIACIGEGERTFNNILNCYKTGDYSNVHSIAYLKDNACHQNVLGDRITELRDIPSPYTTGVFDSLMKANPNENWVGLWETNRGCPFSCTYCVWGSNTQDKIFQHPIEKVYEEIDWFSRNKIEFIFCCDANFGILKRDKDIVEHIIANKEKYGYPKAFSVQNTKNSALKIYEIYKLMSDAGLSKGVSLALQSVNPSTLESIRRSNVSTETFQELQNIFNDNKIATFTDLIIALPEETYESFRKGTSSIIENGQHNRIQFINLTILTNAEMDDLEYQKKYGFIIKESKIVNIHGNLEADKVQESQRVVVGTHTMPKEDWIKTRVFGWMVSLLYFNKLLQVPFIIMRNKYSIPYHELFDIFMSAEKTAPIISEINKFFCEKANDIQNGGYEYCESKEWLNIWWPADELMLIKLCTGDRLSGFYREAEALIGKYLEAKHIDGYNELLHEAVALNQQLLKTPLQQTDLVVDMSYNIWDVYRAKLAGENVELSKGKYCYEIMRTDKKWQSWTDWCREVIWWSNKAGAYLYSCKKVDK
ncbi:MAG: radical SAM protein [Elusimicrobiota bacterium]